jgi:hypothetical protein
MVCLCREFRDYSLLRILSFIDASAGLDYCVNTRNTTAASQRGLVVDSMARWCVLIGIPNEERLGLHLSDQSRDAALVYYEPQDRKVSPALHWLDENHLNVDLGEVTWLTPQVSQRAASRSPIRTAARNRASNSSCPVAVSYQGFRAASGSSSGA